MEASAALGRHKDSKSPCRNKRKFLPPFILFTLFYLPLVHTMKAIVPFPDAKPATKCFQICVIWPVSALLSPPPHHLKYCSHSDRGGDEGNKATVFLFRQLDVLIQPIWFRTFGTSYLGNLAEPGYLQKASFFSSAFF